MNRRTFVLAMLATPNLASCKRNHDAAHAPSPREVTDSSVAYFCGMSLGEHSGPKAQIFIRNLPDPYWFASVRDAFAFLMLPETPKAVVAVYVNDMAKAKNWANPERATWMDAHKGLYVIGSRRRGGMNTDETIPFGTAAAAQQFVTAEGGRIVRFNDMPRAYVLGAKSGEK